MLYATIVADPPWRYTQTSKSAGSRLGAEKHYPTMSIAEIAALPVPSLAAADAMLWLWVTNSHLPHAFGIIAGWGFEYKTTATWVKNRIGMGYWLRGKTEHLLLAVRGKPDRTPFKNLALTTVIQGNVTRHSAKPEQAFDLIESLSGSPRLEMFARVRRFGWDAWGNEVASDVEMVA